MSAGRGFRIVEQAPLRRRNTFGIDATAPLLAEVNDAAALPELFSQPAFRVAAPLVLGGGSNVLFAADPDVVVSLDDRRIDTLEDGGERVVVRAGAGAEWHGFVMRMLSQGFGGLENLALIPGTVGAAPIQNIGAYGVEVCDRIRAVEAFERATGAPLRMDRDACRFAYRDSVFKQDPDRYVVTAVEFELARAPELALDYAGLREELAAMSVAHPTAAHVAEAVVRLRRRKLPDPAVVGNAGSFFKNPIVPVALAEALKAEHPTLPVFPLAPFPADAAAHGARVDGASTHACKLSAAWLIDRCGWKGFREGDAGVSDRHALVLVNYGGASGAQLLDLARRIAASVQSRFGVALEPEPRIVGARW